MAAPKKATPSLKDILGDQTEDPTVTQPVLGENENNTVVVDDNKVSKLDDVEENPESSSGIEAHKSDGSDPIVELDDDDPAGYAEPSVLPEVFVTETLHDGHNGINDNFPDGWDINNPTGTTTYQTATDNASTHTKLGDGETVYAQPSPFDDKGLGKNVEGVLVSEAPQGARESLEQSMNDNADDDKKPFDNE
jgi:hypothetical protein